MGTLARNKLKNLKNLSLLTMIRLQYYDNFIKDLQKKRKKEKLKNMLTANTDKEISNILILLQKAFPRIP